MHDRAWQQTRTAAGVEATIRSGKEGGMPPFGAVLTTQQIRALARYVKGLR
jgi:mono/diheme cytochrome c family protein